MFEGLGNLMVCVRERGKVKQATNLASPAKIQSTFKTEPVLMDTIAKCA